VLFHERLTESHGPRWVVLALAERWRAMGHDVASLRGTRARPPADLLVPNVDLTGLPPAYVRFISKRSFSRLGVREGDGWRGPVIVKSDLNAGGQPERKVYGKPWRERRLFRRLLGTPREAWRYPVFDSVDEVPRRWLRDRRLHVERFVPERVGELYCARSYAFAGSHGFAVRNKSTEPVVKARGIVGREEVPVPDELREVRRRLGFDFGKSDYTVVDGEVFLLDVNRTPTFAANPGAEERHARSADALARGLLDAFGLPP